MIRINLKDSDKIRKAFNEAPKVMRGVIITMMPIIAKNIMTYIREEAPRKTGNLQDNGHEALFSNGGLTLTIQNSDKAYYAPFVNYGTRPHIIRVKKAKVLTDGVNFFGKIVHHPGSKANPYFDRAIQKGEEEVDKIMGDAIDKAIKNI